MLNKDNIRELAYVTTVDAIEPIEGRDRVECARVGGWTCMVPKGAFKAGMPGIYFEIDSLVPLDKEVFAFCSKYKGHIKTQKFKTPNGQFWSQGLLMTAEDFGWTWGTEQFAGDAVYIEDNNGIKHFADDKESMFLTEILGVKYYEVEDQKRKAPSADKYKKMAQRHPKIFKNSFIRWLYKKNWGKKFLFVFFGKKKDTRNWPSWVVKTDEERVQNMPWILEDKSEWYATEKIDGTSTTFTLKRGQGFKKNEYYVCSRNVVFDTPEKAEKCFYDSNVYLEMNEKYHIKDVLTSILNNDNTLAFVTLQGETYGEGIQKRDYNLKEHKLATFNLIFGFKTGEIKRCNPREMTNILSKYEVPCVPIVDEHFILPNTVEELLTIATDSSKIDGGMREGLVFRSSDGSKSFKAVSNEFLMKYHS